MNITKQDLALNGAYGMLTMRLTHLNKTNEIQEKFMDFEDFKTSIEEDKVIDKTNVRDIPIGRFPVDKAAENEVSKLVNNYIDKAFHLGMTSEKGTLINESYYKNLAHDSYDKNTIFSNEKVD